MSAISLLLPLLQVSSEIQQTGAFYSTIGTGMLVFFLVSIIAIALSLRSISNRGMLQLWKLKWTAVVIIFGLVGCIAYFFIGLKEAKKEQDGGDEGEESEEKEEAKPQSKPQGK
ncbi:MAG: PLDc N-terminal domain-containing protein, partial [Candidatus Micrarchaeota archaeon]|nr:PLDc N-terminal domain-containing protein [Candidatus Micrarchaeota archaeon]